jgi:hypothetical protein
LLPLDLKLEIDQLTSTEAVKVARFLSGVVGTASQSTNGCKHAPDVAPRAQP